MGKSLFFNVVLCLGIGGSLGSRVYAAPQKSLQELYPLPKYEFNIEDYSEVLLDNDIVDLDHKIEAPKLSLDQPQTLEEQLPEISQVDIRNVSVRRERIGTQDYYRITNKEFWKDTLSDFKEVVLAPVRWKTREYIIAALVIGGTIGLMQFDEKIKSWTQSHKNSATEAAAKFGEFFGNSLYMPAAILGTYVMGEIIGNERLKRVGLLSLETALITGALTTSLKYLTHRGRPSGHSSSSDWGGPSFRTSDLSFPSGHTSFAFAVATAVASEYRDSVIIPILAYSMASLTAFSRVHDNAHWASDVAIGALIGFAVGKIVYRQHRDRALVRPRKLQFALTASTTGAFIRFSRDF